MSAERTAPQESTPIFPPGRRLALVIGTNGQPAPARAPLHYAVNDAIDMAHVLQQKYCGFELVCPPLLGAQASSDQIRAAVIELARQLQKDDLALFFFSGHAEALPTGADLDEVYLVSNTFDAGDIEIDCDAHISLRWLRQVLFEHKKAGSVLLILDCCYAGKFADSAPDLYLQTLQQRLKSYFGEPGAASPSRPGGIRLALTATGASAAKEQDGHGVLTGHLLAALKGEREQIADEQGQITFGRLFDSLAQALPAEQPDQRPWHFGAGAGLVLATHPHLSQARRRERERAARRAEARQRLREMISRQHDGFLQDRLDSFVGRQQELKEIRQQIEELLPTGGYLTISGQAGQGKSSIIARLVEDRAQEQKGRERVAYHFIPLNPSPDYQVALLKNLMARLVLKYDLSDLLLAGESRAALSESFPEVLKAIAEQGKQEIIFVDGLDQLQPDQQTGRRDLSFLPQGPGNPPPGIVFVLGTRPNDTLRPLELLKPHKPYPLPAMRREDFDAILRRRQVTLEGGLAGRFYESLERNALYLDLVAQELAVRPYISHQEVEKIVRQLADNPDNLFSLSIERLRWQKELWQAVIKPVLGLLLVASEPLSRQHLKQLLNLDTAARVDGEQLDQGLASLGGLVVVDEQQRYSLFHLKFREYLRQDVQRPQRQYLFDWEDEQGWHRRFVAWCEQEGLERIWQESSDVIEQRRRRYARQHYLTHLFHTEEGDWNRLFRVLDEGAYGKAKVWHDSSMRAYALDLDLGRQAAAWPGWSQQEAIDHLPHLWRYTLLRCSLASWADRYPREAFELMLLLGEEAKALGLAELLTKPEYKAEIFTLIAAHLLKQPERERAALHLLVRAKRVIDSLSDNWHKAETLRGLAVTLAQAGCWQEAERVIDSITDKGDKIIALSELGSALALAGRWQEAEQVFNSLQDSKSKVEELNRLAMKLVSGKRWQEAERVIGSLPNDEDKAIALSQLAEALVLAGCKQEAERCWQETEKVIDSLPDDWHKAEALRELAESLVLAGCRQEAEMCWQEALQVINSLPDGLRKAEALRELAKALARANQWQEAEGVIDSITDKRDKIIALSELAKALEQAKQCQQAERLWQETRQVVDSLSDDWHKAEALRELAKALARANQWQEAEGVIDSITDKRDKIIALSELAKALEQAKQCQQAERLWQETRLVVDSLLDDWHKAEALRELAESLVLAGHRQEAEQIFDSWQDDREKAETLTRLATILAQEERWEEAEEYWQEAEQIFDSWQDDREKAEALTRLATILAQEECWEEAEEYWQKAEEIFDSWQDDSGKAEALMGLGIVLVQAKQWEEAQRVIDSLPVDWHKVKVLSELGAALVQADQRQKAEECWQTARWVINSLLDDQHKVDALRELGTSLVRAGRWKEMWQIIGPLPDWSRPSVLVDMAADLMRTGWRQQAQQIIDSLPEDGDKAEALAQAERGSGSIPDNWRKAEALAWHNEYDRLVSLVQQQWRQATNRDEALELLPLAFGLIPRSPELGMALFEAFGWVDEFLQGGVEHNENS